jgi:hypothetical protein
LGAQKLRNHYPQLSGVSARCYLNGAGPQQLQKGDAMLNYHFTEHNGVAIGKLGDMELSDDHEAFAFGKQVIRELMHTDGARYAGWSMEVTEGERVVGSIPFNLLPSAIKRN